MNNAQYPLHHVPYASAKFEVALSNGLGEIHLHEKISTFLDSSLLGQGHKNIAQYPLHHVTNTPEKKLLRKTV